MKGIFWKKAVIADLWDFASLLLDLRPLRKQPLTAISAFHLPSPPILSFPAEAWPIEGQADQHDRE